MSRQYQIADDELELSCDCVNGEDTLYIVTTTFIEDDVKEEIAFCSLCGNTKYTEEATNGWHDMDKNTFRDAPQHIIENHKNQIKNIVRPTM